MPPVSRPPPTASATSPSRATAWRCSTTEKYGHSARDNVLGISLLRSPLYPDPYADEGEHRFTYSLFPHRDSWEEAGVVREAFALNSPLCAVPLSLNETGVSQEGGFMSVDGIELALGTLKRAEDDGALILRLYEPHGARGTVNLHFEWHNRDGGANECAGGLVKRGTSR